MMCPGGGKFTGEDPALPSEYELEMNDILPPFLLAVRRLIENT